MARQRKGSGSSRAALESALTDAVASATEVTAEAELVSDNVVSGRGGLQGVFAASMKAVADTEPGDMNRNAFDAALEAARTALDDSVIPSAYERMSKIIASLPDRVIRLAARQAAGDAFYLMPAGARKAGGDGLLSMMRDAAADASKTRLGKADGKRAVRDAGKASEDLADFVYGMVSDTVSTGVSVHAATVAMFEVGIRGTAPGALADAVEETCRDLPESARRHDDILVSMVVALSSVVSVEAAGRRGYQTAVRAAERTCRNAAADRILETVCGKTFETVYGALAACAYSVSNGRTFESGYGDALATVCGVDPGENLADMPVGLSPEDMDKLLRTVAPNIMGQIPKSVLQQVYQNMSADMLLPGFEPGEEQKLLTEAMAVDYKEAAADPALADIISLYKMAYDAGCEGAGVVAKSLDASRPKRVYRRQPGT